MKINVIQVLQQLAYEEQQLTNAMNGVDGLVPSTNEFIESEQLKSNAYSRVNDMFTTVTIPLIQGVLCMIEAKYEGNNKYLTELRTHLAGMGKVDLDNLQNSVTNMTSQIAALESNKVLDAVTEPYTFVLEKIIKKMNEKIEKLKAFIAATNGCYDDYNQKYLVVQQGIAYSNLIVYDSRTGTISGVNNADLEWARKATQFYNDKANEIMNEQYGDYLKDNRMDKKKVLEVINYERFHPGDVAKINEFLGCLQQKDIIGIKSVAYSADPVYRELWIRYLDRYKIELTNEGGAYFTSDGDKIVVNIEKYRSEKYHTFFHECGHAIDNYAGEDVGKSGYYSNKYKTEDGKVFEDTIKSDVKTTTSNYIDNILKEGGYDLKDASVQVAKTNVLMSIMSGGVLGLTGFEQNISDSVSEQFDDDARGRRNALVSDVYSGVTNYELVGDYSHSYSEDSKGNYWYYNNFI